MNRLRAATSRSLWRWRLATLLLALLVEHRAHRASTALVVAGSLGALVLLIGAVAFVVLVDARARHPQPCTSPSRHACDLVSCPGFRGRWI